MKSTYCGFFWQVKSSLEEMCVECRTCTYVGTFVLFQSHSNHHWFISRSAKHIVLVEMLYRS